MRIYFLSDKDAIAVVTDMSDNPVSLMNWDDEIQSLFFLPPVLGAYQPNVFLTMTRKTFNSAPVKWASMESNTILGTGVILMP